MRLNLTPTLHDVPNSRRRLTRRAAFTLLEVLIVVAILVILGGAASVAYFRYLEDAKAGRAQNDMRVISDAYKKFYGENGNWPQQITDVAPQLEQGAEGLKDPWGNMYQASVESVPQSDGSTSQRPKLVCQPPNGKPPIIYPKH